MERVDFHVALELCEIVSESATLVRIVFRLSPLSIYVASPRLGSLHFLKLPRCYPAALPSMSVARFLHSCIPDSNENFVTILRLTRSFGQSVHRHGNFESAQVGEGVVRPALPWLCAFHFVLC
jgi:hypothetical protein